MKPLYAFYGDDFTGSTDVLEQLAAGGVPAVLFLRRPDPELRSRFPNVLAFGLAGDSRSRSPGWMDGNLPKAFMALADASILHYKTCSTFDSSANTGSIGKAMDIGLSMSQGPAAILVGAPHLKRYVLGGNLFAAAGNELYRLDRHPTMSRHPVTPMQEADLRLILASQTKARIELVTFEQLQSGQAAKIFDGYADHADAVLFDGVSFDDLDVTGKILLSRKVRFTVGSSGVTRALVLAWQAAGLAKAQSMVKQADEVERMLVISGSCSPVTARQIEYAGNTDGYDLVSVNVAVLVDGSPAEERRLADAAIASLQASGRCVIHTAQGPLSQTVPAAGDLLGAALGRVAKTIIQQTGLRRMIFAGGDTSSHGVAQLGVDALTWEAPVEIGAPLVKAHAQDGSVDGLQLVLKGGQMGSENFFEVVRRGGC